MVDIQVPVDAVQFFNEIGKVVNWLQALGIVVLITIILNIIAYLLNRKRLKEIENIKKDMNRIESKINLIVAGIRKRTR